MTPALMESIHNSYRDRDYERCIELGREVDDGEMDGDVAYVLGRSCIQLGKVNEGVEYLWKSILAKPSRHRVSILALILKRDKGNPRVPEFVKLVLGRYRGDGEILMSISGLYNEAGVEGQDGERLQRSRAEFYSNVGRGDTRGAIRIGRTLLEMDGSDGMIRATLSQLLFAAGQIQESMELISRQGETVEDRSALRKIAGSTGSAPMNVIAVCEVTALGDFLARLIAVSKLKVNCPNSRLRFVFKNDRAFKMDMIRHCYLIDETIEVSDFQRHTIESAVGQQLYNRSMVLNNDAYQLRGLGPYLGHASFRVPAENVSALGDQLAAMGVRKDAPLVALHYRQGSSAPFSQIDLRRDVQSSNFHSLAEYVTRELGCQVVRLGHPNMDRIPAMDGYVDLASCSLDLQLFATSRSRFMVGTDSGMVAFGLGFGIPTGRTNVVYEVSQEGPSDIILLRNLVSSDGYVVSTEELYKGGRTIKLINVTSGGKLWLMENTVDQLKTVAQRLWDRTQDVSGWRQEEDVRDGVGSGDGTPFPMNWTRSAEVVDLAELLSLPIRKM